jgi:hypothetical protein
MIQKTQLHSATSLAFTIAGAMQELIDVTDPKERFEALVTVIGATKELHQLLDKNVAPHMDWDAGKAEVG